jgi:hypothetical protein
MGLARFSSWMRLIGIFTLTMAVASIGCGSPATSQPASPRAHRREASARPPAPGRRGGQRAGRHGRVSSAAATRREAASRRRLVAEAREGGEARRAAAVRKVTASYLRAALLLDATFTVTHGGYGVTIAVPESQACTIAGRNAARAGFAPVLRQAVGFLEHVAVEVAGRAQPLDTYQAATCGRRRALYERRGTGAFTSPPLLITRSPWVLLVVNQSGPKEIEVVTASRPPRSVATVALTSPGVTSRVMRRAGAFRLRVRGRDRWAIAVLEAAAHE